MAAGHRIPNPAPTNRTIDKNLDEAQSSGDLDLSNRKLNEFPKTAESFDLSDTVEANLSKNRFTEIPKEICQFLLLEKLNCYHNAIRSLPESLIRMQYLSFIDLSRNQLSMIPPFLCHLKSLEVLLVSNNRLVSIPEEIGQLSTLMELDVSGNEVTAIPAQIGNMGELKILNLRKNMLMELPQEISKLKLKSLDFSCNRIQAVPLEFRHMESLEELILDNNPLISPPAHICTKGRVHILKYLKILAIKEDKRGLGDLGFNRNTLRRSYQKEDAESIRLRRRAVVSTDSGYITDNPHRWTSGAIENGFESVVKAAESTKEQRAERHLELQKRICNAELHSPNRSGATFSPTADGTDSEVGTGGNISPLKLTAGGGTVESGEDMFARELQRQKQEYEQRKKRAEQVKAEGSRRSGKPPTPVTLPVSQITHTSQTTPTTSGNRPGIRPLQAPLRTASVHSESEEMLYSERKTFRPSQLMVSRQHSLTLPNPYYMDSGIVHGYNSGAQHQHNTTPSPSGHFYNNTRHRDKDGSQTPGHDGSTNGGIDSSIERSITDSHRSSPLSVSSQDGEGRTSGNSSVASSGAQELNSINRPHSAKLTSNIAQRKSQTRSRSSFREKLARPASASTPTTDTSQGSFKAATKSAAKTLPPQQQQQTTSGKTGLRVPKAIKARSKTAPLPRTSSNLAHQQQPSSSVVPGTHSPSSSAYSKPSSSSFVKLSVKAALTVKSSRSAGPGSTQGKSSATSVVTAAPPPNSKFGFQPIVSSVNIRNVSPRVTNGRELPPQSYADPQSQSGSRVSRLADDEQNIADIKQVIEARLKMNLPNDVMGELRDGVILCHLANNIKPRTVSQIHVKSSAVPKLTMAKCKRNVENFLEACRKLGVPKEQMCTQADIIDDKHPGHILRTINSLIDLKTNNKSSNSNQTTASRSSTHRSRSGLAGSQSKSANGSRTAGSKQSFSHPPLQSFV